MSCFGGHFSWQAQYFVNLDLVLKGSIVAFCESVVEVAVGNDYSSVAGARLWMPQAHFAWQVQCFVDLEKEVAET